MRRVTIGLLFGCAVAMPSTAEGAFALITSTKQAGGNVASITTPSVNTTGADLIVITFARNGLCETPLSDSNGNTWNILSTTLNVGGDHSACIGYTVPTTVGSGHTFTLTAAACFCAMTVTAWSGSHATPLDQEGGNTATASTTVQAGSETPTENNELVISGFTSLGATSASSIDGGFTIQENQTSGGGASAAVAYLIQTTAAAANPTWTAGASSTLSALTATFKAGAAPASCPVCAIVNNPVGRGGGR